MRAFNIAGRKIGEAYEPYVIATIATGHDGSLGSVLYLMDNAKLAGADAVKIHICDPDALTIDCATGPFLFTSGFWAGHALYDVYTRCKMPREWLPAIFRHAHEIDIPVIGSVFDVETVGELEFYNVAGFAVESFEIVHTPLLDALKRTGKPVMITAAACVYSDVKIALSMVPNAALLHGVGAFPCPIDEAALWRIKAYETSFEGIPIGYADHTLSSMVGAYAYAQGASIIEKHICLPGAIDPSYALNVTEFDFYVARIRECAGLHANDKPMDRCEGWDTHAYEMTQNLGRDRTETQARSQHRSVYVIRDIARGEPISHQNVRIIRPAGGMPPFALQRVLSEGATAAIPLRRGMPLTMEVVDI